jgi:hypothetical protein
MTNEYASFYYNPTLLSGKYEMRVIQIMFEHYVKKCAEAKVSEYLDLNNYKQIRSVSKCRAILRAWHAPAFEFSVCLN